MVAQVVGVLREGPREVVPFMHHGAWVHVRSTFTSVRYSRGVSVPPDVEVVPPVRVRTTGPDA